MGARTFYLAHPPAPIFTSISAELVLVTLCVAVIAGLIGSELSWVCPPLMSRVSLSAALLSARTAPRSSSLLLDPFLRVQVQFMLP